MPVLILYLAVFSIVILIVTKLGNKKMQNKTKKTREVFVWIVVVLICEIILFLYQISKEDEPALCIDYGRSYVIEMHSEGNADHYTALLCVRNRRLTIKYVNKLYLYVYGKNGNDEGYELVVADRINSSDEDYLVILPFCSRQIEYTFNIMDFGKVFNLDCIKYADC